MPPVLVCVLLVTVLCGGTGAEMVAPTGMVAPAGGARPTGVSIPTGPDDAGDQPQLRTGTFGWPLPGPPAVVRAFQAPTSPFGPGHRGVDLAAVAGAPVFAAGAGTVVFAGAVAGHGVVSVDHPGGLRTTYEPVSPTVTAGDRVARGEQLGIVQLGHPGCPATACLHWGVRRGSGHDREYLDPLRLVVTARVRLLPIGIDMGPARPPVLPALSASGGVEHLAP